VVGQVIAVGIFLTPGAMARELRSPFWLLAVWLSMGAISLCGALCYGALAARFPEAGGGYVYLREAWGQRVAFLYGWKCLLVMDPGLTAALAMGLAAYASVIVPLGMGGQKLLAAATLLLLAAANILGLRLADGILRALTLLKLLALGCIVLLAFAGAAGRFSHFVPFVAQHPGAAPLLPALAGAMVSAFFSFAGWWEATKISGEVREPERTLPQALALGVAIVTVVYVAVSAAFVYLVPFDAAGSGATFVAQAGSMLFGPAAGSVLAGVVVVCILGSLAALALLQPRVYYAMARDGVFLEAVGRLHPRFGTPARASGLQALMAMLLVALGSFDEIVAYFVFVTVAFITLTVAGVYRIRRRSGAALSVPGFPWSPLVFISGMVLLLGLLAASRPKQALLGVLVVALGVPVYAWVARSSKRATRGGQA
jgi:APA family basic amino acid/polyamine antiporter